MAPARYSNAETFPYYGFEPVEDYAFAELSSGERIYPPRARHSGDPVVRISIALLVAICGGLAAMSGYATLQRRISTDTEAVSLGDHSTSPLPEVAASAAPSASAAPAEPAASDPPSSTVQPLSSRDVAAAPGAATGSEDLAASGEDNSPASGDSSSSPQQRSATDLADPYRKRAAAVGLHPDLSRVLLTKLSQADFHNADFAIRTAVAETSDSGVFTWPRPHKATQALFEVHFVPGADPHCRRYVVTVTKDRWTTTARPMEKCGSDLARGTVRAPSPG